MSSESTSGTFFLFLLPLLRSVTHLFHSLYRERKDPQNIPFQMRTITPVCIVPPCYLPWQLWEYVFTDAGVTWMKSRVCFWLCFCFCGREPFPFLCCLHRIAAWAVYKDILKSVMKQRDSCTDLLGKINIVLGIFKRLIYFEFLCMCFASIYACVPCVCSPCGGQQRVLQSLELELELWAIIALGTKPSSLQGKQVIFFFFFCWTISPAPIEDSYKLLG